jgi:hypothetical protein
MKQGYNDERSYWAAKYPNREELWKSSENITQDGLPGRTNAMSIWAERPLFYQPRPMIHFSIFSVTVFYTLFFYFVWTVQRQMSIRDQKA